MEEVINIIGGVFTFLNTTQIMGLPLLAWLVIGVLFTMIGAFIRGKK